MLFNKVLIVLAIEANIVILVNTDEDIVNNFLIDILRNNHSLNDLIISDDNSDHDHQQDIPRCHPNYLIDKTIEMLLPEDYEEVPKNVVYEKINHINETIVKINRLNDWISNVTDRVDHIVQRVAVRVNESAMRVDISDQCRTSIIRMANGIANREIWALRCML